MDFVGYMGQYRIVVHFGHGSILKNFVSKCVFSLIQLNEKCQIDTIASLTY